MGACLSRKKRSPPPPPPLNNVPLSAVIEAAKGDPPKLVVNKKSVREEEIVKEEEKKQVAEEESPRKKEVFVVKHRKSHDRERPSVSKEEENKVSVSCGTENGSNVVVRTSSCTKEEVDAILIQCGRLSRNNSSATPAANSGRKYAGSKRSFDLDNDRDVVHSEPAKKANEEEDNEIRDNRRHRHRQSSQGRRRTLSRERESASSGRRVSRSPAKRSSYNSSAVRPGKMVSVPATVESQTTRRVAVKKNVGEAAAMRVVGSPRSQSPARMHSPARRGGFNESNQPSLSRSNSRKAEQSPYRRNPLTEIDSNKPNNGNTTNRKTQVHHAVKEAGQVQKPNKVVASAGDAKSRPQTPTRSRIARRSRDFDFNSEPLTNPNPSYMALLLEDIQSFHQKNTSTDTNTDQSDSFLVPACLSKACSILEAVADLNSTTSSNRSCTFSGIPASKLGNGSSSIVESEVEVRDDLRDPSMHKYVTVRRGGDDLDGQESSECNSFVGGRHHHWGHSREPNSADSTDRWSSRSNTREDERSPLGFQNLAISETGLKGQRTANGRGIVAVASL